MTCADPGTFVRGVQVSLDKKSSDNVFSPRLILQTSNGQFQTNLSFFKVPEGVQHFPGGGGAPTFPGGGGGVSNCFIPYRDPYNFRFSRGGGSGPPVPPLDPHLYDKYHYHLMWLVNDCATGS